MRNSQGNSGVVAEVVNTSASHSGQVIRDKSFGTSHSGQPPISATRRPQSSVFPEYGRRGSGRRISGILPRFEGASDVGIRDRGVSRCVGVGALCVTGKDPDIWSTLKGAVQIPGKRRGLAPARRWPGAR
jgi:hypothetical protein